MSNSETNVKQREQEILKRSLRQAVIGSLAAGIAHEINNPLSVIIGRIDILISQIQEGQTDPQNLLKALNKMSEMGQRISRIVASMRKVARGQEDKELTAISLSDAVDDMFNVLSVKFRNFHIELDLTKLDKDLKVVASSSGLPHVLITLARNSLDELQAVDEENRHIWISSAVTEDKAQLIFRDSGRGVNESIREQLFSPFVSTKPFEQGFGVGLYLAREIMREMGGDLILDTEVPGACFILSFVRP